MASKTLFWCRIYNKTTANWRPTCQRLCLWKKVAMWYFSLNHYKTIFCRCWYSDIRLISWSSDTYVMNQTNTHNNNIIYAYSKMPREVISCWEIHGAYPHSCADMPCTMGNVCTRTYFYILPNIFYFWWKLYSCNMHSIHYYGYSFRIWNITILAYTVL